MYKGIALIHLSHADLCKVEKQPGSNIYGVQALNKIKNVSQVSHLCVVEQAMHIQAYTSQRSDTLDL